MTSPQCELCEEPPEFSLKSHLFTYQLCHVHVDYVKKILWELHPDIQPEVTALVVQK